MQAVNSSDTFVPTYLNLPNHVVYEDCNLHTIMQFPILYDFTTYKCIFTWQLITNLIPSPKIAHVYMLKVTVNDRHCHYFQITQNCNTFSNTYELLLQCLWHVFLCVSKQTDLVSHQTAGVLPLSPCVWFYKTSHTHFCLHQFIVLFHRTTHYWLHCSWDYQTLTLCARIKCPAYSDKEENLNGHH
jgi:hypothetical protein